MTGSPFHGVGSCGILFLALLLFYVALILYRNTSEDILQFNWCDGNISCSEGWLYILGFVLCLHLVCPLTYFSAQTQTS